MGEILKAAGFPSFVREFQVRLRDRVFFLDFAYPELGLAIEVEGWQWHAGTRKWQYDLEHRNLLTNAGWQLLHFTWRDVAERPGWVVEQVRSALSRRKHDRFPTLIAES